MKLKLSLILVTTTILLLTALSFFYFKFVKETVLNQTYSHLESISATKVIRIKYMIEAKNDLASVIGNNYAIVHFLNAYISNPSSNSLLMLYRPIKRHKEIIPNICEMHILTRDGNIIASTDSSYEGRNYSKEKCFLSAMEGKKYMDGFHFNKSRGLSLNLTLPVYFNYEIIGAVLIELDARDIVSLTRDHTALGKTGETILAGRLNGEMVYLTPLRFDGKAALHRKVDAGDTRDVMNKALSGKEGFYLSSLDYRDKKVLASTRYIKATDWGMVTKIDVEEAMEPVQYLGKILVLSNLAAIFLAVVVACLAGDFIVRPVKELTESANKIKEGDLTRRVHINSRDEIGALSNSFNKMAEKLERKIVELDKFAYVISHDLRAPLNSIIPLVGFVKKDYKNKVLDRQAYSMLDMIEDRANTMGILITEILESAKADKKVMEPIDLNVLVRNVSDNLIKNKDVNIIISSGLPTVHYPKISMMRVFQNLIGNSIKYMNKPDGVIKISCMEERNFYKFCIADNGIGIKRGDFSKIFREFSIVHNDPSIKSSGLGLSIVKKIIEDNKGKIWFESTYGEGTSFYFTIPKIGAVI